MKRLIYVGLAGLVLAGCAPVTYTKADLDGKVVCHAEQMDQVERQVRKSFATVMWYNCPRAVLRVVG